MKKLFLLSLLGLFIASLRAEYVQKSRREELVEKVESCEAVLQEFMAKPETAIPASVLQRAKAIVILNQVKAGLLFGFKDGYGVIMVRQAGGQWSIPVLISAGEGSIGLQAGINTAESILIFTEDQTARLLVQPTF